MMSRKTRVLHMVDNLNYGGMERVVAELIRRVDASRFEMHVLALGYLGHFSEGLDAFATLHLANSMPRLSMIYPWALARQLGAIAPDVVHLHSGVWYKGSTAASLARVPFQIYTEHGRQNPDPWLNRAIDRRASRSTDAVACVSEPLKTHLGTFVKHPSRISVIHNGVDTDRHSPRLDDGEFRREMGVATGVPVIGSIGRLEPVKGYEVLVRAFAHLLDSHVAAGTPRPVLVIVGDGSSRESLARAASELGASDAVRFVGWRSDIERVTRAFTVFSMSSHSEGTSVSLLESMSAGLCPVVTDVGGNSAVLGPDLRHRLVPAANPKALARGLSDAIRDDADRARDAKTARERVLNHFSLESMVRKYEELYTVAPASNARSR